ncbi:MAG: hypothetical protein ABIS59_03550 [Candidatus Saccharibacteria bacterium]
MTTVLRITNAYAADQIQAESRLRVDLHRRTARALSRALRRNGEYWRTHAEFANLILDLGDQLRGAEDFTVIALASYLIKLGEGDSHDAIADLSRYSRHII